MADFFSFYIVWGTKKTFCLFIYISKLNARTFNFNYHIYIFCNQIQLHSNVNEIYNNDLKRKK
jgi:hypothetical protein